MTATSPERRTASDDELALQHVRQHGVHGVPGSRDALEDVIDGHAHREEAPDLDGGGERGLVGPVEALRGALQDVSAGRDAPRVEVLELVDDAGGLEQKQATRC